MPTPPRRKKLIEVALPLEAINKEAAREKSIRHGHPSTLHLWWARRPLAACRAVLFASLVDDPESDPAYRRADGSVDVEAAGAKRSRLFDLIEELVKWENSNNAAVINKARAEIARCVASRLIELGELKADARISDQAPRTPAATVEIEDTTPAKIKELSGKKKPAASAKPTAGPTAASFTRAIDVVRMLAAPEAVNHFLATYAPPVLDPFAGGGSIPLEAQRLGLRAYASDLNPVPVLINKALIEIPPKFAGMAPVHPDVDKRTGWSGAAGMAEDVRRYGQWMRDEAEKRIGHLYPKVKITADMANSRPDLKPYVGEELTVIAWLWARTVKSPNPAFAGVHVPLASSFWLTTKAGKETWIKPILDPKHKRYSFEVQIREPKGNEVDLVENGTKLGRGCKFRCILSDTPIPEDHIKSAGKNNELDATLLALVCEGTRGQVYLSPTAEMERIAKSARPDDVGGIAAPLADDPRNLWCLGYGLDTFDKLFNARQLTLLLTLSDLIGEVRKEVLTDSKRAWTKGKRIDNKALHEGGTGEQAYADAVATYLAFRAITESCG